MTLPVCSQQLAERDPEEGISAYHRRCWEAEFHTALSGVRDVPVRHALFALWNLTR